MATFQDLPTELQLQVFQHSTLISLIRARCVCQQWRSLALASDIPPIRREFYEIYLTLIDSPEFLASRAYVLEQLNQGVQERHRSFNRQEFVNAVSKQHPYVPEDFALWILEWPERAVIGSVWPNLPFEEIPEAVRSGASREGWNFLANEPVAVFELQFGSAFTNPNPKEALPCGPALPIWETQLGEQSVWLILDSDDDEDRKGKVYRVNKMTTDETGPNVDDNVDGDCLPFPECEVFSNWTQYFREMVKMMNEHAWVEGLGYTRCHFETYRMIGGNLDDRANRWAPHVELAPLRKQGRERIGRGYTDPRWLSLEGLYALRAERDSQENV
ncbi:hypothetical protein C8J56DRAFT_917989 [Mycena floridula]|nr:hypothetical protein C8J56DRAFT_917989 [Mycena floridula]